MKKIIKIIFSISILAFTKLSLAADGGMFGEENGDKLRRGEVHVTDIPDMIKSAIDFFMGFAGTIAVIFIIVGAYKILFGSLKQDKTEGRNTIIMAITGFVLAALAWVIIKLILDNFS